MKKLMVLGAAQAQVPLILAAKRLGYYVIAAGIDGDYPGIKAADEACFVDIADSESVLEMAMKLQIDGVATCCMDTGIHTLGLVCERMGLCGLSEHAALCSRQKLIMKEALLRHGVKTAIFRKITSETQLSDAWNHLPHPVILKASDLAGSRGCYVCRSLDELQDAYFQAMRLTHENFVLIEQFIEGVDIGAQAFVYHGEILFILPHNDEVFKGSANKPIGHSVPLSAPKEISEAVKRQCELAIRAIDLDNCAVNIDLLWGNDGQVYVIELTGRAGATCLPETVSLYYGTDYYTMIAKAAMDEDPRPIFENRSGGAPANASRLLIASRSGMISNVRCNVQGNDIALLEYYVGTGDYVQSFSDGRDRIGQVVVTGKTVDMCLARLDEIVQRQEIFYEDDLSGG